MKRTRAALRVKNTSSGSDSETKQNNLEENVKQTQRSSRQKNKTQIYNSENLNNITTDDKQSAKKVNVDQTMTKKLDFKKIREILIAANSDANEEIKNLDLLKEELKQLEDPPVTQLEKDLMSSRLTYSFYDKPCEQLAQNLLGKILVRRLENGTILKGRIVETEAYLGSIDKCSMTYEYRVSASSFPLYMPPGTISVYSTYGMYHCFNISSQGDGYAVLIRGLEPIEGLQVMAENRNSKKKSTSKESRKEFKNHELCNGPSKFCMAFFINKDHSKYSLCSWKGLWIEEDNSSREKIKIVKCKRIGIDRGGPEWANKPLRYYIYNNESVSKRDQKAEANCLK